MSIGKEWLEFLREQYPVGSRIVPREMGSDGLRPISPGSTGKLKDIDDIGTFHVDWDNGRSLGLVVGVDSFSVMPLTADLYTYDDYGGMKDDSVPLGGRELRGYEGAIMSALLKNRMAEEAERGLMHWYGENDSVNNKVRSATFAVEKRDGLFWGVAECKVAGTLTVEEMATLKDYISGQASDGWGEGFEQREIDIGERNLYVHLWSFDDWDLQTEQERFGPKIAEGLPEMRFSVLPSTGDLICIKRGESGYYLSDWNSDDREENKDMADYNNERLGVTRAQRLAMETGSMHGWDVPGADPAKYLEPYRPWRGGMKLE